MPKMTLAGIPGTLQCSLLNRFARGTLRTSVSIPFQERCFPQPSSTRSGRRLASQKRQLVSPIVFRLLIAY